MGSAYVIQVAEGIVEDMHQMRWKTIIEVAKFLSNDATVTQAECTAVETAKAICCLARAGCIFAFHQDGNKRRNGKDFEDLIGQIKVEKTAVSTTIPPWRGSAQKRRRQGEEKDS